MDRRNFVKYLSLVLPAFSCGCSGHLPLFNWKPVTKDEPAAPLEDIAGKESVVPTNVDIKNDVKHKSLYFDHNFPDDVLCSEHEKKVVLDLVHKFRMVQRHVGYGNFNLLGMDEFIFLSRYASGTNAVTASEKKFLESLFFQDAKVLGFYGEKVFKTFTDKIEKRTVVKIPRSGHYLRKGKSLESYNKIVKDVGNTVILTSGVRGVAKQFHLFLEKTSLSNYNLSKASRSLAPPGYSFHGQNDFDIGKVGLGLDNFTERFASTREYKVLTDLGYVDIRYEEMNNLGVRFEPWHIKI